ncbi:MAG: HAD-IIB family hydrolase, partial [Chloroflexi bacterium]|nr:HAD-IIB family hydrolase [Chloroflexota bacterium]
MTRWIVITDLDGTLLDANTYQPGAAAREALRNLQARDIPVVFCSAKTHAEQEPLRSDLAVADPFIVENGSALIMPDGTRHVLGDPGDAIHERLDSVRKETGLAFQTYQDIGLAEVAGLTGLTPEAAERACQRDYSATVVTPFSAAEMARFQQVCAHHGLQAPSGGRFITVTGSGADKGQA